MIYIFTLFVCMFCLIYFDIFNKKHKWTVAYKGLLIWVIAISALQYKMGTDMEAYMAWYKDLNTNNWSFSNLINDNKQYQPGWVALGYLCRFITDDFLLLKLVQATFVNIAVFSFFKRETRYVFVSILLYGLMSYLVVNFNLLRQSIALGFALYGFTYLRLKQYKKYYVFVLLSYLFHNSAIILIPLPIFALFNYTKKNTTILFSIFILIVCSLYFLNIEDLFLNILSSGFLGDNIAGSGLAYMSRDRLGVQSSFSVFSIQRIIMIVSVVYYMRKYNNTYYGAFGLIYIFFQILTGFLPILWRFRLYFDFSYYIILSQIIVEYPKSKKKISSIVLGIILILVFFFPLREYMTHVENSQYRNIDQYYPYHSIFDKEHDVKKQHFFDSLTL